MNATSNCIGRPWSFLTFKDSMVMHAVEILSGICNFYSNNGTKLHDMLSQIFIHKYSLNETSFHNLQR